MVMDEEEEVGAGLPITLGISPGELNQIENPNPFAWNVEIESSGGSLVRFTVPSGGSFSITPNGDFARVCVSAVEASPLAIEPDDFG